MFFAKAELNTKVDTKRFSNDLVGKLDQERFSEQEKLGIAARLAAIYGLLATTRSITFSMTKPAMQMLNCRAWRLNITGRVASKSTAEYRDPNTV